MAFERKAIRRAVFALAASFCLAAVTAAADDKNYTITQDDRTMGSPDAPIVLIEYAAPSCPHCAHFAATVLPLIKKNYIDTGKVYYVFRIFPLMPADGAVAGMANCLPKDRYFEFIELAFRQQRQWDPEYGVSDVVGGLTALGKTAGMKQQDISRCMLDAGEMERVNRIAEDGDKKYNIEGVPFFIVNGTVVPIWAVGWPQLKLRFDALLAKGG